MTGIVPAGSARPTNDRYRLGFRPTETDRPTGGDVPFRPFDCQLANGLRSVGSCRSFPPLVGRGVPGRTWITDEIARDQAWLATRSLEQPVGQGFSQPWLSAS